MQTEKNIEQLLKELSADKKPYPKDLLNASRASYMSQVSAVISNGPHFTKGNGQGGTPPASAPMTPLMKIVLTALIAANVALASYLAVTAYKNWDKIQEMLFGAPPAGEISPAPVEDLNQTPEAVSTPEITISPEGVVTPNATPDPTNPSGGDNSDNLQVSTPEPDGKDNPGKHLGQTPHTPGDPPGQDDQEKNNKDKNKNK